MGLDQYLYKTKLSQEKYKELENMFDQDIIEEKYQEIYYLRKVPRLHGFMEKLYYSRGGSAENFNCVRLYLSRTDIDTLEKVVNNSYFGENNKEKIKNDESKGEKGKCLFNAKGFFFGDAIYENEQEYRGFIRAAKEALNEGQYIFYDSWW